jgi:uncharacterized protein YllA (UPF0747 family)
MVQGVKYTDLKGYPHIFEDFLYKFDKIKKFYPANISPFMPTKEHLGKIDTSNNRHAADLIISSMAGIELNDRQKGNLECLEKSSANVVLCEDKPIFAGGPLFILIKAISTIKQTQKLNTKYPDKQFVPVFYIDDDEHNNLSCSELFLLDSSYSVRKYSSLLDANSIDRTIVKNLKYDNFTPHVIDELFNNIEYKIHKDDLKIEILSAYKPERTFSDAFIHLMNKWLGDHGVLFASAGKARELGLFKEAAKKELDNPGRSIEIIKNSSELVRECGWSVQYKNYDMGLKLIKDGQTQKIEKVEGENSYKIDEEIFTLENLLELFEKDATCFAPHVMNKPMFRDLLFPVATIIASSSEIGFTSQFADLYEFYDVNMPAYAPRHSATMLDKNKFEVLSMEHRDNIIFNFVFPMGHTQERLISSLYFMSICGREELTDKLFELCTQIPDSHYSVNLS